MRCMIEEAQWPIGNGVGLRIKRSSVRIRPWLLRWVLGQGSLLPLSQGEAFTLASISYLAILVKYILAMQIVCLPWWLGEMQGVLGWALSKMYLREYAHNMLRSMIQSSLEPLPWDGRQAWCNGTMPHSKLGQECTNISSRSWEQNTHTHTHTHEKVSVKWSV